MVESFQIRRIKGCKSALSRQIREAVEIGNSHCLLNLKEEYNRCLLPSIHVEGPPSVRVQQQKDILKPNLTEAYVERALE